MGKALYVEATAVGYYGGKRVAGSKFWLADGKAEFSKKWMKEADPSQATEAAPQPVDGGSEAEQNEQIAELTKAAETAEAERKVAEDKVEGAEKERDDAKTEAADLKAKLEAAEAERDKLKADLESATAPASTGTAQPAAKPAGASDKGGNGNKA